MSLGQKIFLVATNSGNCSGGYTPGFRRNDLLAALFRYAYMTVVQRDRPWVIMSCLDHMVPFTRNSDSRVLEFDIPNRSGETIEF